jgi:hypothetical protein
MAPVLVALAASLRAGLRRRVELEVKSSPYAINWRSSDSTR